MASLLVIGAGISGLALGHLAARAGHHVTLLERAAHPGGLIDTRRTPDGFFYELGAHTLYRSYAALGTLLAQAGLEGRIRARGRLPFRLFRGHTIRSIAGELHLPSLLVHLPRAPFTGRAGRTVRDYATAVAGARNWDRVLRHALAAVMSQDLADAPAELVLKRRPRVRSRLPRSFTLRSGLGDLVAALAAKLTVTTGVSALAIGRAPGGGFRVTTSDGVRTADALALACDVESATRLLATFRPDLAALLAPIGRAGLDSEAVVVPRPAAALPSVAGLIGCDAPFFSVVTRDPIPDPHRRAFTFHFRPGLSPAARAEVMSGVLGVPARAFLERVHRTAALPCLRVGHAERIRQLDAAIAREPLLVAGNYLGGASLEDCVTRAASEWSRWACSLP